MGDQTRDQIYNTKNLFNILNHSKWVLSFTFPLLIGELKYKNQSIVVDYLKYNTPGSMSEVCY